MMRRRLSDDSGQATPLILMFLLGIVAVAGLVIDGGFLFASRRSLQSMADGAARAGAMAVDERLLRDSRGAEVVLEPEVARAAADDYLTRAGFDGQVEISASSTSVKVNLYRQTRTLVLSIVGVRDVSAQAQATAAPRSGIARGGG
jgi:putative Flp pilus-assembly TadE/G-like protein